MASAAKKAAGKAAWRKRVAKARAAGKKHIKVGKHLVAIGGGRKAAKKGGGKRRKARKGGDESHAKRVAAGRKAARTRKRNKAGGGGAKRKSRKKARHPHKAKVIVRTRTKVVRGPRSVRVQTRTRWRKSRAHLMENPLTPVEMFAGGLTMFLGLATADLIDRGMATHALTDTNTKNGDGSEIYIDTPPALTAADGKTQVPGLRNRELVQSPMNLKRWGAGAAITVVPFVAAAFVKGPTLRSALQLFGFGAGARVLGKGLKDLFVRLLNNNQSVQRFYADSLVAQIDTAAVGAQVSGQAMTAFPNAANQATGLGHLLAGDANYNQDLQRGGRGGGSGYGDGGGRGGVKMGCSCGGTCVKCQSNLTAPGATQTGVPPQAPSVPINPGDYGGGQVSPQPPPPPAPPVPQQFQPQPPVPPPPPPAPPPKPAGVSASNVRTLPARARAQNSPWQGQNIPSQRVIGVGNPEPAKDPYSRLPRDRSDQRWAR